MEWECWALLGFQGRIRGFGMESILKHDGYRVPRSPSKQGYPRLLVLSMIEVYKTALAYSSRPNIRLREAQEIRD